MNNKFKKIKLRDIFGSLLFLICIIPALIKKTILKISGRECWLICEREDMARDNGYVFFKYMIKNHPEIKSYYAINPQVADAKKILSLNQKPIKWGSLKHYYLYMSCTKNISSHKEGNPNHPLFTIMHRFLNLYNNRVFLQHGILDKDISMFYYKNAKFKKFICGSKMEYEYVKNNYGYKNNEVVYTGLARFDEYNPIKNPSKNIIAVIPTWRDYLTNVKNFKSTRYYKEWIGFLKNEQLLSVLRKNNTEIFFYPHMRFSGYEKELNIENDVIKYKHLNNYDIRNIFTEASMVITDYSSVAFDFGYQYKPVLYFQFDKEEFFNSHIKKSNFSHEHNGLGDVVYDIDNLVNKTIDATKGHFKVSKKYRERSDKLFLLHDTENCERIYRELTNGK